MNIFRHFFRPSVEDLYRSGNVGRLTKLVGDKSAEVREAAIRALVKLGNAEALSIFSYPQENIKLSAISIAGETQNRACLEVIAKLLLDEKDTYFIRLKAAECLGQIGDPRAIKPLIAALQNGFCDIRRASATSLDLLSWQPLDLNERVSYLIGKGQWEECIRIGPQAVDMIITCLDNRLGWPMVKPAANALGRIGDSRAVEPLIDCLKREAKQIGNAFPLCIDEILGAIIRLRDRRAIPALDEIRCYLEKELNVKFSRSYSGSLCAGHAPSPYLTWEAYESWRKIYRNYLSDVEEAIKKIK